MRTASEHPPQWAERLVAALLPPSRRDQVLGDLEERFVQAPQEGSPRHAHFTHDPVEQTFIEVHEAFLTMWDSWRPIRAQLQYVRDAMQLVPSIMWRHLWRRHRAQQLRAVGTTSLNIDTLQRQAEELQDRIWRHHLLVGLAVHVALLEMIFTTGFGVLGLIAALPLPFYYRQWRKQGAGRPIPPRVPLPDLITLHRESLKSHAENIGLPFGLILFQLFWILRTKIVSHAASASGTYLSVSPSMWRYGLLAAIIAFGGLIWISIARNRIQSQIDALSAVSNTIHE